MFRWTCICNNILHFICVTQLFLNMIFKTFVLHFKVQIQTFIIIMDKCAYNYNFAYGLRLK